MAYAGEDGKWKSLDYDNGRGWAPVDQDSES